MSKFRTTIRRWVWLIGFGCLGFMSHATLVSAEIAIEPLPNLEVYGDFVVGPGKEEIILRPGETRRAFIKVSNRLGEDRRFLIGVEDFTGSKDPEQSVILLGNERGPYSLRDYLFPEATDLIIEHGTRAVIPIIISIPEDAEPGGRYGSVLISTEAPDDGQGGGGAVTGAAIVSRIGVLFFIRVMGDVVEDGSMTAFQTAGDKAFFTKTPISFELEYTNNGSVHLNPYGTVEIKNLLGDVVGYDELDPWFTLPDSVRKRQWEWGRPLMIGRYVAEANINRGYGDIVDTKHYVFWVLPVKPIAITLGVILLILFLFRFIFSKIEIKLK